MSRKLGCSGGLRILTLGLVLVASPHWGRGAQAEEPGPVKDQSLEIFLDRLMMAESGGVAGARNPRSSAVGPYQFIVSTFLYVAAKYFGPETAGLQPEARLALRLDHAFSRRAAEAYTRENAEILVSHGLEASYRNLRLAFLAGPGGAVRVLSAKSTERVAGLLGSAAIAANPFMARMTAQELLDKCARDIDGQRGVLLAAGVPTAAEPRPVPRIAVKCKLALASCRRWLALATARLDSGGVKAQRKKVTRRGL